jgi:hypothetical protein
LPRFSCFGSISTTMHATDTGMQRLERACLSCVWQSSVRVRKSCSRSYSLVGLSHLMICCWQIFWFGSISTAMPATNKWMRRFERAHLNCVNTPLVGAFMIRFHGDRGQGSSPSGDLQLARFFVLARSPPPRMLRTWGCDGSKERIWIV